MFVRDRPVRGARAFPRGPGPRRLARSNAKGMRVMHRTETRSRLATMLSLSMILAVVPACTASAGHGVRRAPAGGAVVSPQGTQPYIAYRPAYPVPGTKPLFLSN